MNGKWVGLGLLLITVSGALALHWTHGPALAADDHGQYLLHARNLAEGKNYADIGFLHSKHTSIVAPVAEPPLVPLLIAAWFRISGSESLAGVRLINAAFLFLYLWTVYRVFRSRGEGTATAAAIAICAGILPLQAHILDAAMADLPYCALIWLACLAAGERRALSPGRAAGIALLGALAFSARMASLPLIPAGGLLILLRPRAEKPAWIGITSVWVLAAGLVMFGLPGAEVLGGESIGRTPAEIVKDFVIDAKVSFQTAANVLPIVTPLPLVNKALKGMIFLLAVAGILLPLIRLDRAVSLLEWMMAGTLAMILALPVRDPRYTWILLPFFVAGLIRATLWIAGRQRERLVAGALVAAAWFLIARTSPPNPAPFAENAELQETIRALQSDVRPGEHPRAAVFSSRSFIWQTRIPATGVYIASYDETLADLRAKQITHVITGDGGANEERVVHFRNLVEQHPERFERLSGSPNFGLFRMKPD